VLPLVVLTLPGVVRAISGRVQVLSLVLMQLCDNDQCLRFCTLLCRLIDENSLYIFLYFVIVHDKLIRGLLLFV